MKRHKWFVLMALIAAFALVAAACAEEEEPTPEAEPEEFVPPTDDIGVVEIGPGEPVKVATLQAISGDVASLGTDQVRAVEIAIDDRGGELLGHPIELQSEDDGCAAEEGLAGATKIVSDPQVLAILGTSCSGAGVPASDVMSEAGLVMISGSNTSPFLTSLGGVEQADHHPGYFRTAHNDEVQGAAAATFAFEELGAASAASIHDGDPYTSGLAGVFDASFQELGGDLVLATAISKGDTDMRPVLTEIAGAGAELIFFPIFEPEGNFIAEQAAEIEGLEDVILMGADGLLSDTFIAEPESTGMYFSGPARPEGGEYEEFVAKYEEKYAEAPIAGFHAHMYDGANMLFDAIEAVGVQGPDGTLYVGRQALRNAVGATSGYAGLTGSLTCDEFGDCADPRISVVQKTEDTPDLTAVNTNILFIFEA